MPRPKKSDKFYIIRIKKSGKNKGRGFLCLNFGYKDGVENITLKDLNDYIQEHNIDPDIPLHKLSPDFALDVKVK